MLINLFKKNYINQYLLIFPVSILLWVGSFVTPNPMEEYVSYSVLYDFLYRLLNPYPLLTTILAYILVMIQGLMFNQILNKHKLVANTTVFPMFLYILFSSAIPYQTFNPILISNIFVLKAIDCMMDCVNIKDSQNKVFLSAILISISTLFYVQSIYYLILLPITLMIFKIYYWREWTTILFGFALPQIILLLFAFFTNEVCSLLSSFIDCISLFSFNFEIANTIDVVMDLFVILIFIVSFFAYFINSFDNIILYRKKVAVISWSIIIGISAIIYQPFTAQMFVVPFSFFMFRYFLKSRYSIILDVVLLLLLASLFLKVYI